MIDSFPKRAPLSTGVRWAGPDLQPKYSPALRNRPARALGHKFGRSVAGSVWRQRLAALGLALAAMAGGLAPAAVHADPAVARAMAPVQAAPPPLSANPVVKPAVAGAGLRLAITLHDVDADRRPALERLTRQALADVQGQLQTALDGDLHIEFVGSPAAFNQVMTQHGAHGWQEAWIAGLAILDQDRIIVQVNGPGALLTSEVVHHELAHVTVHRLAGGKPLPRWFHEGVAMWLAGEASYERLRNTAGAAGFGQLDNLASLNAGFRGGQTEVERAYATAGGFVRFAVARAGGDGGAVARMHQRMRTGLDFESAFTAAFGMPPDALYSLYTTHIGTHASRWTLVLSDGVLWALVSILAVLAMGIGWRHRPRFDDDGEPLDLEAIAAAGQAALQRPWQMRDFRAVPLVMAAAGEHSGALAPDDALADEGSGEAAREQAAPVAPDEALQQDVREARAAEGESGLEALELAPETPAEAAK